MIKKFARNILKKIGYEIHRIPGTVYPVDMIEEDFIDIHKKCRPYTMISIERMYSLYQAVKYVAKHKIPGDFVECGVWKGGSVMLMAYALLKLNDVERRLYLYDTYAGMSKPQDRDIMYTGELANNIWVQNQENSHNKFCYASLDEVTKNLLSTNYPREKLIFVKGEVEKTIPDILPDRISILRLDSDWYESTYHELQHLFPRLVDNGVIIIDDYGCWKGAKEAVDKYFAENNTRVLLNRVDYTGRIGIKK